MKADKAAAKGAAPEKSSKKSGKTSDDDDFNFELSTEGKLARLLIESIVVDDKINARNHGKPIDTKEQDFLDLTENIAIHGMISPVLVWEHGGKFTLAAGFRRTAAAKALGWTHIDARVIEAETLEDIWMKNIAENLGRVPLRPYDLSQRLVELKKHTNASGAAIARRIAKSDAYVNNLLRMREKLHPSVLDLWKKSEVNYQGAKDLAGVDKEEQLDHPIYRAMIGDKDDKDDRDPKKKRGASTDPNVFKFRPKREIEMFLANLDMKIKDPLNPSDKRYVGMEINFPGHGYYLLDDETRATVRATVRYLIGKWPGGTKAFYRMIEEDMPQEEEQEENE